MQPFQTRYGHRAAAALVAVLCLWAGLSLFFQKASDFPGFSWVDPVSLHEQRIEPLRAALPPRGNVGYVTGLPGEAVFARERAFKDVELLAQFILTQYTLAPLFLHPSTGHPLVVGNYIGIRPDRALLDRSGLAPERDFGDGLILYRRKE